MSDQIHLLSTTIESMYDVISFPEGGEPNWNAMASIFHPQARLTRITPEGVDLFDPSSFRAMAEEMLERGVYTSFFEREVARQVHVYGSLAHVLSAYETKGRPDAASFLARGVNSIQLLWTEQSWRVLSLFWDEETERNPLDVARLFTG
jgi:hypothetical protein